jgi:hypothetical protein
MAGHGGLPEWKGGKERRGGKDRGRGCWEEEGREGCQGAARGARSLACACAWLLCEEERKERNGKEKMGKLLKLEILREKNKR